MQNLRRLLVYPVALELAKSVYDLTAGFPKPEQFGLTSQMQRASVSVGANISEGCGRRSDAALRNFLYYSMGSASELDFQLDLSQLLHYGNPQLQRATVNNATKMRKMLSRLIGSLDPV